MQIHPTIASYIQSVAYAAGFRTRRKLAKRLEVSPAYLTMLLNGQRPVPEKLLSSLEDALHLKPGTLKEMNRETAA
jgi:transcriptional regulator with XRE-family HTH domain